MSPEARTIMLGAWLSLPYFSAPIVIRPPIRMKIVNEARRDVIAGAPARLGDRQ
jgi:hypothetical protein